MNDTVLEEFIHKAEKNSQILIAKGYPPEQCTNEDIQFYFENEFTNAQQVPDAEEAKTEEPDNTESEHVESEETESEKTEEPEKKENTEDNSEKKTSKENPAELETEKDEDEDEDEESDNQKTDNEQEEKNSSEPVFVKKGTLIAQIVPGEKGKPGKDVLGYPIQANKPSIYVLNAGSGVIKKGTIFIAQIDGRPLLKNPTTIMVEPVAKTTNIKAITGNISCDTKDNYESVKVEMIGIITWEAIVKCHSLLLLGSLFGSVTATDTIDVKGDIGTDKKLKDQDSVNQANIICKGSVKVSKSIINSDIQTAGELLASNSTIKGSQVVALQGMTIHNVVKGEYAPSTLWVGIQPNDKIIAIDHTLDIKNSDLSILQKKDDIAELKEKYKKDLKEETHDFEQAIFKNLIEIIKAPELFQSEGLKEKLRYLYGLPEFSSIRTYYLKIPETDAALEFLDQIMTLTKDMTLEEISDYIQNKIDPEPEEEESDEDAVSKVERIEIEFKARLAAFEQEITDESEKIEKIENEIKGLQALRKKLGLMQLTSLSESTSTINIKNRCEKGTIIKGKIARHVVEKTIYNVIFKEIIDPATNIVFISIGTD
ncbi:FapA family protein [Desulfobacterales bacterium HSG17]|nr:FapA family protein [Desulfobacterales bacterium HSG17]